MIDIAAASGRYRICKADGYFSKALLKKTSSMAVGIYVFGGAWTALILPDLKGMAAWGKLGVAVSQMRSLAATLSGGDKFDMNASVIVPRDPGHRAAVWAYCCSPEFPKAIRQIDRKVNVTTGTLVKVPFDLAHWQKVAAENHPDGLPDPT
jgi:hypothetical protein